MGRYTIVKTWVDGEALLVANVNTELNAIEASYNNIEDNANPALTQFDRTDPVEPDKLARGAAYCPVTLFHFGYNETLLAFPVEQMMRTYVTADAAAAVTSTRARVVGRLIPPLACRLHGLSVSAQILLGSSGDVGVQQPLISGLYTLDLWQPDTETSLLSGVSVIDEWTDHDWGVTPGVPIRYAVRDRVRRHLSVSQGDARIAVADLAAGEAYRLVVSGSLTVGIDNDAAFADKFTAGLYSLTITPILAFGHQED